MKILFITDNFPPEVNAPATRTYEHCREWQKKGAEVTVITCAPNFPKGKVFDGYKNKWRQEELMDGIKVVRVWSYMHPNKGIMKRILDFISFAITSWWASLWIKTDIIIATSPQFFAAVSGYFSSIFKRKPWIMEVRDLWPKSMRAVSALNNKYGTLLDFFEKLELFLYKKAKRIVVVTESFKKDLVNRGVEPHKIHVVKNGVQLEKFAAQEKNPNLVDQLGLEGKFVVGYLGTHGMAHKLDFILDCAQRINGNTQFLLIGDGAEKANLLALKKKLDLQNVIMLDIVPQDKIVDYISVTDIALVNLKKSDTFKEVIPSKIFENAAMQKPILLGVEGESKEIIEKYSAGLAFEPENEIEFIDSLTKLHQNPIFYQKCQKGCENLAKDFDRKKLANDLYKVLSESL